MESWGKVGRDVVKKLEGVTDENAIKDLALATVSKIRQHSETPAKRENARKSISREIHKVFPNRRTKADCYYHDPKGKEDQGKWRHLIFKYLKLDSTDYDAIGGEERAEWKAQQTKPTEQQSEQSTEQNQLTLENMSIEQLQLDAETTSILENALEQSGMGLPQFIQQAVRVYAKTIMGKTHRHAEDLTTVSTQELLTGDAYKTHPGRARELVGRAIRAIKLYNSSPQIGSNADRWCITQSAIARLTGAKAKTIGEILEKQYKDDIASYNKTYEFTNYTNRKPGKNIEEVIKLAELVPSGLD